MTDIKKLLTPSQYKLLIDQEQWMKDSGIEHDEERTRLDTAYDIIARFPTEQKAKLALEMYAGDPTVLQLYRRGVVEIQKRRKSKKKINTKRKCKCT